MLDRIGLIAFVVAVALLAFVAGSLATLTQSFPSGPLRDAYLAGTALWAKQRMSQDRYATDLWRLARRPERGVTRLEPDAVAPGYTLYTSGDSARARLIALDGTLVHEWHRPYSSIWHAGADVEQPQPDRLIFMEKARLLPNGDLFAIYEAAGDTPWGYGMAKLDRDARVIWTYLGHTHHDFDLTPDGRVVVLTHGFTRERLERLDHLARPRLDDHAVVLSPDGEELRRVSLTRALAASRFRTYLHATPHFSAADPLHTNTIEYITAERARAFPHAKDGDLLVNFRDMGLVAVLDPERETIVWATRGPWIGQHDPSVLANGRLLLFDNLGGLEPGNDSRVLEVDPHTLGITWRYAGDREHPFSSTLRSSVQRLGNGNVLVTESDGGRLFEVSRGGDIVWEYLNPVRGGDADEYIPVVSWGQRIAAAELDADFAAALAAASARAAAAPGPPAGL